MRRGPLVAALLLIALATAGCGGDSASPAADAYIAEAADSEERDGLIQARDDIDAEMRAVAARKDEEIEKLRREKEELEAELAERGIEP
jgi:ABC-type glycerol-3-phosphate transport system substrate-binding protein